MKTIKTYEGFFDFLNKKEKKAADADFCLAYFLVQKIVAQTFKLALESN
jgi:hypothetical protein